MASFKVSFSSEPKIRSYAKEPGVYVDLSETGFALEVSPKGKAVWTIRVRSKSNGGKEVPPKVMDFEVNMVDGKPLTNYKLALSKAQEIKKRAAMTEEELKAKIGLTLDEAFRKFMTERRVKRSGPLVQETKVHYLKVYNTHLKKYAGRILKDTNAGFWSDVLRPLHERTPSGALAAQNLLSGIYNHLISRDAVESNPLVRVRMQQFLVKPEPRRESVQTIDIKKFVDNISKLRVRHSRDVVTLFLITGFRNLALLGMRWDQLNFEYGYYEVKPRTPGWKGLVGKMPLSTYALEILKARKEREVSLGVISDYIFPKRVTNNKTKTLSTAEQAELRDLGIKESDIQHGVSARGAVKTCSAGLDYEKPLRTHDLRRTFNSAVYKVMGGDLKACGALLGHKWITDETGKVHTEMQLSANYAIHELYELRANADRVVNFIRQIAGQMPLNAENRAIAERVGIKSEHFELAPYDAADE